MDEVGVLAQYKVAPRDDGEFEAALRAMSEAMAEEEFSAGGVMTYAFYRVPFIFGHWYGFGHFAGDALACHGQGPKVRAAGERMMALQCRPVDVRMLTPVIVQGCGERIPIAAMRPADADPSDDVGVVYSFRADPDADGQVAQVMRELFDVVDRTEIPTGNVLTYNLYRDTAEPGRWTMFEHFTARGSADHATDPAFFEPGLRQVAMLPEPFSRILLKPFLVFGCGEPMPA